MFLPCRFTCPLVPLFNYFWTAIFYFTETGPTLITLTVIKVQQGIEGGKKRRWEEREEGVRERGRKEGRKEGREKGKESL